MHDPFFGFDRAGFGGGQTRVTRRVIVTRPQLSTPDPFLTRFQSMLPTMEPSMNSRITHRPFFDDDDDDDSTPSPPSKADSSMITRLYRIDGFPAPFPSKVEPPKAPPRYDEYYKPPPKAPPRYDEYNKPPPRANPPMMSGGYYGDGFYPPGGNPVNVHVNLHMEPQGLQAPKQNANTNDNANSNRNANNNHNANTNDNSQAGLPVLHQHINPQVPGVNYNPNGYYDSQTGWHPHNPQVQGVNYNPNGYHDGQTGWRPYNPQVQGGNNNPNGYYNSQTGGGQYNPQVQGGNRVDGDGEINMGNKVGNINTGGGKAGGGQTGGGNYNANSNYNGK